MILLFFSQLMTSSQWFQTGGLFKIDIYVSKLCVVSQPKMIGFLSSRTLTETKLILLFHHPLSPSLELGSEMHHVTSL